MGDDPRLPKMPDKPTMLDFFELRFRQGGIQHLLQSANLAKKNGHPEKIITACLLHDIGVVGFIQADHGYWGAQLVEPYVDEEISWAIRTHQALRFYPDESVGYTYPEQYVRNFGADYKPEPYIEAGLQGSAQAQVVHDQPSDQRQRPVRVRPERVGPRSKTSWTSWAATSASPRKAWASTTARWRTCGAR